MHKWIRKIIGDFPFHLLRVSTINYLDEEGELMLHEWFVDGVVSLGLIRKYERRRIWSWEWKMVTKWLRCKFTNGGWNAVRKWFNENWQHWRFKNGGEACTDKGFDCTWPHWWYITVAEPSWGNESIEWRIRNHGKSVVMKWPNRIWPGWDFRKIEGSGVKKKLDAKCVAFDLQELSECSEEKLGNGTISFDWKNDTKTISKMCYTMEKTENRSGNTLLTICECDSNRLTPPTSFQQSWNRILSVQNQNFLHALHFRAFELLSQRCSLQTGYNILIASKSNWKEYRTKVS